MGGVGGSCKVSQQGGPRPGKNIEPSAGSGQLVHFQGLKKNKLLEEPRPTIYIYSTLLCNSIKSSKLLYFLLFFVTNNVVFYYFNMIWINNLISIAFFSKIVGWDKATRMIKVVYSEITFWFLYAIRTKRKINHFLP